MLMCLSCWIVYQTPASEFVPVELQTRHARWVGEGRPSQHSFGFRRDTWKPWLPEFKDFIDGLPAELSREFITNLGVDAAQNPRSAAETLIASNIWGNGMNAKRGPWYTHDALATQGTASQPLDGPHRLQLIAIEAKELGLVAAFNSSVNLPNKLDKLGTSFATKYLFFISNLQGRYRGLVLDRVIANWFAANTSLALREGELNPTKYGEYLFAMYSWASELGETPETIEWVIFWQPR